MKNIKIGDTVKIISGDDKGKQGKVKDFILKKRKIKVEGIAVAVRHQKARSADEKSTKKIIERFIDISNVALVTAS
jgi:large subunit ribosomal protein L24